LTQFKLALAQTPLYISEYVAVSSVEGKVENRLLLALKQDEVSVPIIVSQMFIRNKQGHYSSKMIDLCRDFYLKL